MADSEYDEKIPRWRRSVLERLWPTMDTAEMDMLIQSRDPELLAKARRLAERGCPARLVYRILRED